MPRQQDILYYFEYKKITPSSLVQDNLIYFNYKSPNGVHDKTPLVYVLEKRLDRVFGLNVHYDAGELFELINTTELKINKTLENEFFKKYPAAKKELQEKRLKFSKDLLQDNMSDEEYDLITNSNDNSSLTFKFKIVELFENIKVKLANS